MKLDIDTVECIVLVNNHFNNVDKTNLWFHTKNPLLGNIRPIDMITTDRVKKLKKFIKNCIEGNFA